MGKGAGSVSIIGGADGPTSIFIAGKGGRTPGMPALYCQAVAYWEYASNTTLHLSRPNLPLLSKISLLKTQSSP